MRYLLYHANCTDGFGAAFAAWTKWGDVAKYIPCNYGDPFPDDVLKEGNTVIIADFSFPRTVLEGSYRHWWNFKGFQGIRDTFQVLDHHKSAQADLEGLPFCTFDMNKSGAVLAWEYFHPDEPVPTLLQYMQDRDLWKWELPYSKEISAYIGSWPKDFKVWDGLAWLLGRQALTVTSSCDVVDLGEAILRSQAQQIEAMCQQVIWMTLAGHKVPVVNASVLFSEVGNRLRTIYPDAPFVAYFFDRADGKRQWGLRSRGDFDVSEVAKKYHGGGHKNAAGFITNTPGMLLGFVHPLDHPAEEGARTESFFKGNLT